MLSGGRALANSPETSAPSVALFYGRPLPVAALARFDWVVVQPGNADPAEVAALRSAGVRVFAYFSVGEAGREEPVDQRWVLGRDEDWDTWIVDPAANGWRKRLLARATELEAQGYGGLFLDTLDSYAKVLAAPAERAERVRALVRTVRALRKRHPQLQLFFNRGFEILDAAGELAAGVAAESVLFGWNPETKQYVDVPEADRAWLEARLRGLRERYGIPAVALDYLPPWRASEARDAARRIEELGLVPWISTPAFDWIGVGASWAELPRLLLVYDGAEFPAPDLAPIARLAAPHTQSLGFGTDLHDVRAGLPPEARAAGYAGVVTWFTDDELPAALSYGGWLSRQVEAGVRVIILGRPGFATHGPFLETLGLTAASGAPRRLARIAARDRLIGHEAEPRLRGRDLLSLRATAPAVRVHLRLEDEAGRPSDAVLTAPWGGLALHPYVVETGYQGRARWIVDPGGFLSTALGLPQGEP